MKKVFLVITILISFLISPIRIKAADFTDPYFVALSYVDLTSIGMGSAVPVTAAWFTDPLENEILKYDSTNHTITNMADFQIVGTVLIDMGGNQTAECQYTWLSGSSSPTIVYMNVVFSIDNFYGYDQQNDTIVDEITVKNGFRWYEEASDNPEENTDLSTIQNYLLIISFLLFINFLRG